MLRARSIMMNIQGWVESTKPSFFMSEHAGLRREDTVNPAYMIERVRNISQLA